MTAALQQATRRMPRYVADHVANLAKAALLAELETWPKPGLVSHVDSGSHTDMDASTFKSQRDGNHAILRPTDRRWSRRIRHEQVARDWVEAERAMLAATGGVNTHRGAIFGLGLICAAAGAAWSGTARAGLQWRANVLGATVRQRWGQAIMRGPIPLHSHGTNALRQVWRGRRAGTGCRRLSARNRGWPARTAARPQAGA